MGKVLTLDWLDKLWVFSLWPYVIRLTLTTCKFQSIVFSKHMNMNKEYMECTLPYVVPHLGIHVFLICKNTYLKIKS